MHRFIRSGPLFLMLGVALVGCNQAGDEPSKGPAGRQQNAAARQPSELDYVLTVDGMH